MGGLWYFYIKKMRGEEATINDAFSGFKKNFVQLMLVGAVTSLAYTAAIVLGVIPFVMAIGFSGFFTGAQTFDSPSSLAMIIPASPFLLAGMAAMTYMTICWLFAIPLVIDKNMQFWPAMQLSRKMVDKHWWMTLLFLSVAGLVGSLGILLLIIGVIFSAPVSFAAIVAHYRNVFGELKPE